MARLARVSDLAFTAALVLSVAVAIWHDATDDEAVRAHLVRIDLAFVALFVVEWLVRVARAERPARYALRHSWELVGMVPLALEVPAMLRLLRLARLVRLLRLFDRVGRRLHVFDRIAADANLRPILLASAAITLVGSLLVWLMERGHHPDRPELHTYTEWLWWSIVTVTTVGYGDVTPVTASGRFIAGLLMVTGIGTIGLLASGIASALIRPGEKPAEPEAAPGLVPELERLARLREQGHLTPQEFELAKARLLA